MQTVFYKEYEKGCLSGVTYIDDLMKSSRTSYTTYYKEQLPNKTNI